MRRHEVVDIFVDFAGLKFKRNNDYYLIDYIQGAFSTHESRTIFFFISNHKPIIGLWPMIDWPMILSKSLRVPAPQGNLCWPVKLYLIRGKNVQYWLAYVCALLLEIKLGGSGWEIFYSFIRKSDLLIMRKWWIIEESGSWHLDSGLVWQVGVWVLTPLTLYIWLWSDCVCFSFLWQKCPFSPRKVNERVYMRVMTIRGLE